MLQFLRNLDPDLRAALHTQLRDLWPHTSTALEGNTLTLGETAFVRIHPFADRNGRIARLVANLPVLRAGLPPIIIHGEQRKEYIDALSIWHFTAGQIKIGEELLPEPDKLEPFTALCRQAWQATIELVEEVRKRQEERLTSRN